MIRGGSQFLGLKSIHLSNAGLLLYSLIGMGMNVFVTFMNVDIYHEGDKFPSVVVMADGGMIFRDVNNIYGFFQTLIQVPFIEFFGPHLLVSRVIGLIIKLLIVILFVGILKVFIGIHWAIFSGATYLVITPAWTNLYNIRFTNGFAWPTHYGILFVLVAILSFPRNKSKSSFRELYFFTSSFFLAVSWSARLEFLSAWLCFLGIIVILLYRKEISRLEFISWISGGLLFFVISLYWLSRNGALKDWFEQTILVWFSDPPAQPKMNLIWFVMNIFSFIAIASVGLIGIYICYKSGVQKLLTYIFVLVLILIFTFLGQLLRNLEVYGYHIGAWLFEISNRGLLSFVNIFFGIGLIISSSVIFNFLFRANSRQISNHVLLISTINLSLLSMLHIVNADYIHMFVFTYVAITVWYLSTKKIPERIEKQKVFKSLVITLVMFAMLAISSFIHSVSRPSFPYRNTILAGLSDQNVLMRDSIDSTMDTVAKYSSQGIWSFCISGLPTVATGVYASKDKWVWNLQPEPWMLKRWAKVQSGDYLYVCSLSIGEKNILDRNISQGNLIYIEDGDGFTIYQAKHGLS